jgi:predicted nucleic acid-binding protein
MPKPLVLLDTWALLALINENDQWHPQATMIGRELVAHKRPMIVTDWTLAEFLGRAADPPLRQHAIRSVARLQGSSDIEIVPATRQAWEKAFELYRRRSDKSWSLVDCISILLCQDRGIQEVFTGDHHFEQAGLRILLRSPKKK